MNDRFAGLGEFLRARRARLRPEDVGITAVGPRKVPGLRREELASLIGVSADYYARLEQGRPTNVSAEVLNAVSRALRLDRAERSHLRNLARPARGAPPPAPNERARPGIARLLELADATPAYVVGRRLDVLAWNRLAAAVFLDLDALPPRERNWARLVFLDPKAKGLFADWNAEARETVARLRFKAGACPGDPALHALVQELSTASDDFRRWWSEHEVGDTGHGRTRLRHPLVGELLLDFECLKVPGERDQSLVLYTSERGSRTESALQFLASWNGSKERPAAVLTPRIREQE